MLLVIEKEKERALLNNYFATLKATGYVKRPTIKKFLAWLFLLDFVELMYWRLSEDDYNQINKALICLFSNGDCLLPYSAINWGSRYGKIIPSPYIGTFTVRQAEDDRWRIVETGDNFRTIESED